MKSFIGFLGLALVMSFFAIAKPVIGAELTHSFVNPNFGGSPFNGAHQLANATSQNKFKEPQDAFSSSSFIQSFADRLDRAIVNQLAFSLVDNAFDGVDEIGDGVFDTGINTITVESLGDSTLVTIQDNATGESSTVEIPTFAP